MSGSSVGTTSVPAPAFTKQGFVPPQDQDILAGNLADIVAALGGKANSGLTTPQGQIASSNTASLSDAYAQILAVLNGVDPSRAFGRLQDGIGYIYFMNRRAATATVVNVTCQGVAETAIPAGYLVVDTAKNQYAADGEITLNALGIGQGTFSCTTLGPIEVGANSVEIYQSFPGLTSVSNPTAGATGSAIETRQQFEQRRSQSVAINSVGTNNSIRAALLSADGVADAYVIDNSTGAPIVNGDVTIAPQTLFICVNGGTDQTVGQTIISKKPPGCGYTGTTTVTVSDPNSDYPTPPQYSVTFTRAAEVPIFLNVALKNSPSVPNNALVQIQFAVAAAFASQAGYQIGQPTYVSSFYAAVLALGSWAQVVDITIGNSSGPTGYVVPIGIDQIPVLPASNITLSLV